jgi:hypothetical protein
MTTNSMILHEFYFAGLGEQNQPGLSNGTVGPLRAAARRADPDLPHYRIRAHLPR